MENSDEEEEKEEEGKGVHKMHIGIARALLEVGS